MHTVEQAEKMIYDDAHILTMVVTCALNSDDCEAFQKIMDLVRAKDVATRNLAAEWLQTAIHAHIHEHAAGAVEMQKISVLLNTPADPNTH